MQEYKGQGIVLQGDTNNNNLFKVNFTPANLAFELSVRCFTLTASMPILPVRLMPMCNSVTTVIWFCCQPSGSDPLLACKRRWRWRRGRR